MDNTYNLYIEKKDKFKTASLEVVFKLPFNKNYISKLNIIKNIIINNPDNLKLLKEKYDTKIYGVVNRIGNTLLLELILDYIDPKYSEDYIDKLYKIFFDSLFNPVINKESFDNAKKIMLEEIDFINYSQIDKSILISLTNYNNKMPYSYNLSGEIDDINNITIHNIKEFYKTLINKSYKSIYVVSSESENKQKKIIEKYANFSSIVKDNNNYFLKYPLLKRYKKYYSNIPGIGTNLVMLYSFKNLSSYEEKYVMPLFNIILGGNNLLSILYKVLREDNSLCYNVFSIYQKFDRMIIIYAALSNENFDNALKIVKDLFKHARKNITNIDLENAKKSMINSIMLSEDNIMKTINNMMFESYNLIESIDKRIDNYNKVKLEDIYNLIKKVKLICINKVGE